MIIPELEDFALVGGTALSLQYGHRLSIDIDLFSCEKVAFEGIFEVLKNVFKERFVYESNNFRWGIFCYIDNIKVDIVYYPHKLIAPLIIEEGVRMYNTADISAMKIQAILGRGKKKDFWDIAELLQHLSVKDLIENHFKKYPDQMLLISIPQALTYFLDAEESEDPVSLKGQTWADVQKIIKQRVSEYLS